MPEAIDGRRRFSVVVAAMVIVMLAGVAVAVSSIPLFTSDQSLTADEAVGTWSAVDGSGSLTISAEGSFRVESLSIDPIRRATPLGDFYGSGTWALGSIGSRNGALTLRFTDWGNTRLSTKPPEINEQVYPLRASREDGILRLYFHDASGETRFYLTK